LIKFEGTNLDEQIHQYLTHNLKITKGLSSVVSHGPNAYTNLFTNYQQDKETAQAKGESLKLSDYSDFYIKIIPFEIEKD